MGRVVQIEAKPRTEGRTIGLPVSRQIRFEVVEAFRGVAGKEVMVGTGSGGGDCGYPFVPGRSYVVFASGDSLYTGICSGTTPLEDFSGGVEALRSAANAPLGGRLSGTVRGPEDDSNDRSFDPKPLAGIRVTAEGPSTQTATTDAKGQYEFSNLKEGDYKISAELPTYLTSQARTQAVPERGCAIVSIFASPHTEITGRITDAKGNALPRVSVSVIPWESTHKEMWSYGGESDAEGRYEIRSLRPGKYLVAASLRNSMQTDGSVYKAQFYPNAEQQNAAAPVALAKGGEAAGIDFVLAGPLERRKIQVQVTWPDGKPAGKGWVEYVPSEYPMNVMPPGSLNEKGIASLQVLDQTSYLLCAHAFDPSGEVFRSQTVVLSASSAEPLPKLILETNGRGQCSNWSESIAKH